MPNAIMTLTEIVQDSQDYGSDDEHMVSRVFFDLEIEDHHYPGLHVDVKQTVGSSFETAPLEVSAPAEYHGPMNHDALRQAVEGYYRSQIGGAGRGIRLGAGNKARMRNNRVHARVQVQFEVPQGDAAW
jgi:hypothetical protein